MVNNPAFTLIKIITAMFYLQRSDLDSLTYLAELKEYTAGIKIEKNNLGIGSEEAIIDSLKYTADWMFGAGDALIPLDILIQRLKVNVHGDHVYLTSITETLRDDISKADASKNVVTVIGELRHSFKHQRLKESIQKANRELNFGQIRDPQQYIKNLITDLETFTGSASGEAPGFIGVLDFSVEDQLVEVLEKTTEAFSAEGVLKIGIDGFDKATGIGGIRRGECVNFGALTHNYKSGMLMDACLGIPMFNDPWMIDPDKKPLILRISLENTLEQDIANLYCKLHEIKHQERIPIAEINIREAAHALMQHFGQRGYHFVIEHHDPNNTTPYDLFQVVNKYLQKGYEIHVLCVDYLTQIFHNVAGDREDSKIQKLYDMTRNFTYTKAITLLTAHQLSTEAQDYARNNPAQGLARKFSTGGWYMSCKSLHTKLDLEFILHIVEHRDGKKYLSFHRGKHRNGQHTPDLHKGGYYEFQEFGGIPFDGGPGGVSKVLRKLPSVIGEGDEW